MHCTTEMNWCLHFIVLYYILIGADSMVLKKFDGFNVTTESPEYVETFNTEEWVSKASEVQQIHATILKLETKVRLRYARTRISMHLSNPFDKPLQATFKIILPNEAFFTIFKLRRGKSPRYYTASIESKDKARELFHFAHVKTNGTVAAGLIESARGNSELVSYDLKYTIGPQTDIQGYLVFERQLERVRRIYCDQMHIYPMDSDNIKVFEVSVDVEEFENVNSLECSAETKEKYNCSTTLKRRKGKPNTAEFTWRKRNVSGMVLKQSPFEFCYELEQQNSTSALVIAQNDGNYHFAHLFIPENLPVIRKHIVFLLDTSDSMHGKKLAQLKWSMIEILDDLTSDDFFNIITFSTEAEVWSKYAGDRSLCPIPFPAAADVKDAARNFIENKIFAQGVTNIYSGVMKAFDLIKLVSPTNDEKCEQEALIKTPPAFRSKDKPKLPTNVESMLFFLSDGIPTTGPTNTKFLLDTFRDLNVQHASGSVQIHTVAYGGDADIPFLKALSFQNNGFNRIIKEESGAGVELLNFYSEISSQVLTNIRNSYSINESEPLSANLISSPVLMVNGKEVLTVDKLIRKINNESNPFISSNLHWHTEAKGRNGFLAFETPVYDCIFLEKTLPNCLDRIDFYLNRLQGYQLLKRFLVLDQLVEEGYFCPEDDDIYRDNLIGEDYGSESACANPYKDKVIELATEFGFITPYTSFILTTDVHIDIGLLGSPPGIRGADGESITNVQTPQDTEELPIGGRLVATPSFTVNVSQAKYEEIVHPNETLNGGNPDFEAKGWFTKSVREFATAVFKKLFDTRRKLSGKLAENVSIPVGLTSEVAIG